MKKTSIGVAGAVAAAYLAYSPANAATTNQLAIEKPPATEAALAKLQRAWDTKVAQRGRKFCEVVGSGAPPCDKQ